MSVLIKGMDMPGMCIERHLRGYIECPYIKHCVVIDNYARERSRNLDESEPEYKHKRLDGCPLVEIPTPHGRLIDADAMTKEIKRWKDHPNKYIRNRNEDFIFYLNDAEPVVESEE